MNTHNCNMNRTIKLLFIFLFVSASAFAQLPLNGSWRYSFADDKASPSPSFDDSGWKTIESNKLKWDQELPKTSNIVWIRKKVIIPSSMKVELQKTGALILYLGRIKQEDKFYMNGKYVSETNSGDIRRAYILNEKDVLWDQENTFAVRISHWGGSASVEADPAIMAAKPEQLFLMNASASGVSNKDQVKGKNAVYKSSIKNRANRFVNASLTADFYDLDKKKLKTVKKNITLKGGDNTFDFPFQSPSAFLKVQYTLTIPSYSYKKVWNDIY